MCGLAGCIGEKDEKTVCSMLDALPHRGPDDRGLHSYGNRTFGHTRLSIVDVAHGHQPILANGGTQGIVCNGEIYNFRELRRTSRQSTASRPIPTRKSFFTSSGKRGPTV